MSNPDNRVHASETFAAVLGAIVLVAAFAVVLALVDAYRP